MECEYNVVTESEIMTSVLTNLLRVKAVPNAILL